MTENSEEQDDFRRRVSVIWRYFDKIAGGRVRCKLCKHEQTWQGTPGNILRHLSHGHKIDITLKAQNNNDTFLDLAEADSEQITQAHQTTITTTELDKSKDEMLDVGIDLDPYQSDTMLGDGYLQMDEIDYEAEPLTPKEECIIAEIEYYREKAEYYRMQKKLVALQATKVKRELTQLGT